MGTLCLSCNTGLRVLCTQGEARLVGTGLRAMPQGTAAVGGVRLVAM